ncbi:EamA family transporter [Phytoactinopolyspora mesophila]|uniref:EamA family transporter n=1 Tax=Phytoactinopolyspora mesophila TaxID=2650750 RepID=A0A7K3LYK6_9ACTN|nr:EamA family transporter [Phytoactinopolyspora mesophila]
MPQTLQALRAGPAPPADHTKAVAAAAVTVVLWASAFVAIRAVGHTLSPAPMALARLAVATAALTVMVAVMRVRAQAVPTPRRSLPLIAGYGVLWLAGYTVVLNAAERHVDAGTAALLVNIAPLLIALGAGALLGEGYPRPLIVGSLIAMGGLAVIAMGSSGKGDRIGVALCLLAAVLYAAGVLIQKVALRRVDTLTAIWLGCVVGTLVLLPWSAPLLDEVRGASVGAVLGVIYLGLFPTAIGFTLWAYALRRMDAGRLSATTYAVPAVSVLLSLVLLAESPTVYAMVGGVICLAGVAVSRRPGRRALAPGTRPTNPP